MRIIVPFLLLLAVLVGPSLWVNAVMSRYRRPSDRYENTGAETARQLLDTLQLQHVRVETTRDGDHYDPLEKAVRLSPDNYGGHSLTAVAVAAHEVGHAMQDAVGFSPLHLRTRLVQWVQPIEKFGAGMLFAAPVLVALTRVPGVALLVFVAGLLTLAVGIGVHVLTLPTEFDASFRRALPLLQKQRLLHADDRSRARRLLAAAALTYVSAALQSLLSIARWWRILRR